LVSVLQGWWPDATEEEENVVTGSALSRFVANRRCTLETVLNYAAAKTKKLNDGPPEEGRKIDLQARISWGFGGCR
jgi:hypothetical protein